MRPREDTECKCSVVLPFGLSVVTFDANVPISGHV